MKKFLLSILCLVAMAVTGYATEATVTMADLGYANQADLTTITVDENVAITFAQGTNSSYAPKYYTTGNAARTYAGNVITFSCSAGNMTEIVFNISDNGLKRLTDAIPSTGSSVVSAADKTITWTGDAAEVIFTVGATADYGTEAGKAGQIHIASVDVTYAASSVVANVATPTFTVEAGTYGTKQSVGIECESEGAVIYYTLDGTTPDNTATLYEAPIELNSKTTVKAIAYVGEEASNVASASYDFHLDGKLTFVTAPIFASDMQGKIEWTTEDWASNSVNYLTTLDGTVPTVDNKWNTGTGKTRIIPMFTWKKDTVVTVSVRAEKDGIYSDTFKQTFYIHYAKTLNIYRAVSEMAAGNYVIAGENTLMLPIDGKGQNHGYGYTVDATITNGLASAFGLFEFTFEATDGGYFIKDSKGQYLGSEGTYKPFQIYKDNTAAGAVWSVELQANGVAKITNKGNGRWIQWDSQYKNWATFDKDNGTFMPTLAAAYTPVVTITPEANATVESIDKITVTCPDGISSSTKFNFCSLQGTSSTTGVVAANQVDANTVELVLESPVTENGTYTFVLYKEVLTIAPETINQKYPSATQYIEYTISNNEEVAAIVVTPENESIHKSLQHFTFDYEKGIAVNGLFGGQAPFLGYTDPATGASSTVALTPTAATETSVTLSTDEPQTVDGYYTLIVPAEYFILAGSRPNDAIMNQYMVSAINPNAMNIVSVDPEQGEVTSLKKIVIMFDAEIEVAPETWTITDANGTVYAAQYTSPADLGFMGIQIELKEAITAEGTYTLNIPAGSIEEYMGNKKVEEQTLTWTIVAGGEVEADYIFNAEDHNIGKYETLTDGIYTFLMGEESTKPWNIDANSKSFSNGIKTTQRIKAETDKNYLTANVPEAGKLVFAVMSSSSSATDRTLSVVQNDVELYGKVVCDANDKIDGVYNVHEVAVEAGLATITMKGALNFSYIEFISNGGETPVVPATATWSMEEGQVVETFESVDLTINIEGVESVKPKNTYGCTYFYEKNAEGEWQLVVGGACEAGYMDAAMSGTTITFSIDPICYSKDFISPFSRKGEYRIVVPAGDLYFNGDRTNVSTEEYVLNFTIDNDFVEPVEIDAAFTADPEENTTIKEIREIVITFTEYDAITVAEPDFVNGSNIPMVKMYDDFFESYNGAGYILARAGEAANQLVLYVDPQLNGGLDSYNVEGQYQISVPAGVVYFGQDRNKEFKLHYTVGQEKLAVVSSTPAEGQEVESFSEMIVEFNKPVAHVDKTFSLYNADGTKVSSLSVEMIDPVGQIKYGLPATDRPLAYKVRLYTAEPVTAAGNYYVNMPKDAFTIEGFGEYSAQITINFSVKASTPVVPTTATWSMEEGQVVETFESVDLTINIEGVESVKPKNTYGCTYFYEKNAEGEWQLVVAGTCQAGYMDAAMNGTTITFSIDPICYSKDFISPFSRKGEYRIVVPAGDLYFNGDRTNVSTEEYVLNFTIDNDFVEPVEIDAAFTADPEENTTIKEIREIVLTFTEYDAISVAEPDFLNGSNIPMVKMYDDFFESYNGAGYIFARAGEAANQLVLYVDPQYAGGLESYNVEGQYEIYVPAGVVYFGQDRNKEFTLHYTVGQEKLAVVSSTPAEGQEVESFSEMIVEFNKPVAHVDKTFSLYNADGTKVSSLSVEMIDPVGQIKYGLPATDRPLAYKVRLYTAEPVTAAGNYYVNMPKDAFTIEGFGEYSAQITINFSVKAAAVEEIYIVKSTPANNEVIAELKEIVVEFNTDIEIGISPNVYNTANGLCMSTTSIAYSDEEGVPYPGNVARIILISPITASGTYDVVFEANSILSWPYGDIMNKELRLTFNITGTGIKNIQADPQLGYVVYDMNGILVMQTMNAADIDRLNNGLYIINGVKVLINK